MLDVFFPQLFLGAAQRRWCRRGIPIFTYHNVRVPPPQVCDPFLYVTPARLDEQLATLRSAGFSAGSLSDVAHGQDSAVRRAVITFDDGCRNVLEHALGPLERQGFRAIQFIVAGLIGGRNEWHARHGGSPEPLMNIAELREWLAAGHEIGSHTATHPELFRLPESAAREEIFGSKKRLEDLLGLSLRHFCYPYGRGNKMLAELVAEAGFETACTTAFGVNKPPVRPFALRRIFPLSTGEMLGKIGHRLARRWR